MMGRLVRAVSDDRLVVAEALAVALLAAIILTLAAGAITVVGWVLP